MNILYIDHYAGSVSMGMEFRPYYLAKEWEKIGHNVRIIGADYSHLRKNNPDVRRDLDITTVDGAEFQWIRTRAYQGNGMSRVVTMLQFCWKLQLHAKKIAKEFHPDIVIASSTYPMDAYAAKRIAKLSGGKYIHEVHDMWPITPIELYGMSPRHPFVRIVQHAENYFCRNAERVVSILPCAKDYFMEHGMEEKRFVYIPNGISLSDWESPEMLPDDYLGIINKAKNEKRFILSFFGSHTRSYSLDYLIKALARTDQSRIFVAFVGEGNYKEELIKLAKELGIHPDAYAFLPAINKKAIPSLIRISDASYVGAIKNRMFRFGIGMNKLFDAMMGGKPILYAVDAPNNIVEEYQCGISVPAENTDELANGLVKLIQMPEDEKKQMGENGHNAIMNRFIYPIIAKQFSEIFN